MGKLKELDYGITGLVGTGQHRVRVILSSIILTADLFVNGTGVVFYEK